MKIRLIAAFALPSALLLSACPAAAKEGAANIDAASSGQCITERRMIQTAVESYSILENKVPVSEDEMIPDYLRINSPYYDIDATGQIIPAPGSVCT